MMARINEAWEVLGDPERRAEYDTLYFTLRAAIANAERKQREEERLERQRQERIRKQEMERQQREAEAARKRLLEQERRRAEQERKERERREAEARRKAEREKREQERKEREQREREKRAAEARRKADLERKRREQERINREREEQQERERRGGETSVSPNGSGNGHGDSSERPATSGPPGRRMPFLLGIAVGVAATIVLAGVSVVVALFLAGFFENSGQDNTGIVAVEEGKSELLRLAGPGTVMATQNGSIDCASEVGGPRNTAGGGERFVAEADVTIPTVSSWSIGFLFHLSDSGYSTVLLRKRASNVEKVAWTSTEGRTIGLQEAAINADLLRRPGSGLSNILRLEVTGAGAILNMNGVVLIHVPPDDLRPYASEAHFCAGFFDEPTYTVRYNALRGTVGEGSVTSAPTPRVIRVTPTRTPEPRIVRVTATPTRVPQFVYVTATPRPGPRIVYVTATPTPVPRIVYVTATPGPKISRSPAPTASPVLGLRGSGTLRAEPDGTISCPPMSDRAFLSRDSTYGQVSFDFEVPSASSWSIGLLYHQPDLGGNTVAATFLHRPPGGTVEAWHVTRVGEQVVDEVDPVVVSTLSMDQSVGAINNLAIATDKLGTRLVLNGSEVLVVPRSELRPMRGAIEVCVGIRKVEQQNYGIRYFNLRAWADAWYD